MCIAAAIIGAGVVGAAGSAIAGSEAAGATKSSTNAAIAAQNQGLDKQAALTAPYRALGSAAIPTLENLLGIGPKGAAGIQPALAATPGYQFTKSQGIEGTVNQASAMGLGLSGNTLEGIANYTTGLADTTYEQRLKDIISPVQIGANAATNQASNVGTAATNTSNLISGQGNTLAGIDANTIAGLTKSIGNSTDNLVLANTLGGLGGGGGAGGAWGPLSLNAGLGA